MGDSMEKMTSLTLADNTTEITDSPPLRGIFSLPRELRDQIYGYLLHHEHTRAPQWHTRHPGVPSDVQRDKSVAHTYTFHPNLLSVNRQVHEEASTVLALNSFVVVSAQWDSFQEAKHHHNLPVVCEKQSSIATFKHHHLRVHIRHGLKARRTQKICAFVMVAADLPLFSSMMQWLFLNTASPSQTLIPVIPGSRQEVLLVGPATRAEQECITHTRLQLLPTKTRPMTTALESSLLLPFAHMIIGQQKISIINALRPQHEITALQALMGPRYVSYSPMAWRAVALIQSIKGVGDKLVKDGDLTRAVYKYCWITSFVPVLGPLLVLEGDFPILADGVALVFALLLRTIMDTVVTEGFARLRLGDFQGAVQAVSDTQELERRLKLLPNQERVFPENGRYLACKQASYWLGALMSCIGSRDLTTVRIMAQNLESIARDMGRSEHLEALQFDARALTTLYQTVNPADLARGSTNSMSNQSLVDMLSVKTFEPKVFNTPMPDDWTEPEKYEGFLEESHKVYLRANGFL
ncbi:hypothetical protein LTR27_002622 [Elasticomyces elasticus]|nr:hypothetical protein LTR27_002622 [Elasticomyces elasticus]